MSNASIWAPGTTPDVNTNTTRIAEEFVTVGGQTLFVLSLFEYTPGTQSLEVFKNGLLVSPSEVTEDSGGDRFSLAPCSLSDHVIAIGLVGITGSVTVPADGSVGTSKLASDLLVPITKGGTGAITAAAARTALGVTPANIGALSTGDIGTSVQGFDAAIVKFDEQNEYTAQQIAMNGTLTDTGTITWDCDVNGQIVAVTLGGNRTMAAPSNVEQYAAYALRVTQDATGGRTITWNAAFKFGTAAAPTLTTGANKVDWLHFVGGAGGTMEYVGSRLDAV